MSTDHTSTCHTVAGRRKEKLQQKAGAFQILHSRARTIALCKQSTDNPSPALTEAKLYTLEGAYMAAPWHLRQKGTDDLKAKGRTSAEHIGMVNSMLL